MLGTVVNPVNECTLFSKQGIKACVNLFKRLFTEVAVGNNRLIYDNNDKITHCPEAVDCLESTGQKLNTVRTSNMALVNLNRAVTVKENCLLRNTAVPELNKFIKKDSFDSGKSFERTHTLAYSEFLQEKIRPVFIAGSMILRPRFFYRRRRTLKETREKLYQFLRCKEENPL